MRTLIIALICVLVGVCVWKAAEQIHPRHVASDDAAAETAPPPNLPKAQNPASLDELIKKNALQFIPLRCRPGDCAITMRIEPRATCNLGDIDIIGQYLLDYGDSPLTLSIEPLTPETVTPADSTSLVFKNLNETFTHRFNLDGIRHYARLGIFLCFDRRNSGRCATKPPGNLVNFFGVSNPKGVTDAPEPIFYFEPLVTAGDDELISATYEKGKIEGTYFALFRWLTNHNPEQPAKTIAQEGKRAFFITTRIGSLPVELNKGVLVLPLSRRDPNCKNNDTKHGIEPLKETSQSKMLNQWLRDHAGSLPPELKWNPGVK